MKSLFYFVLFFYNSFFRSKQKCIILWQQAPGWSMIRLPCSIHDLTLRVWGFDRLKQRSFSWVKFQKLLWGPKRWKCLRQKKMQSFILSTGLALQMKTGWEDEGPKRVWGTVGICSPVMLVGPASVSAVMVPIPDCSRQWQKKRETRDETKWIHKMEKLRYGPRFKSSTNS